MCNNGKQSPSQYPCIVINRFQCPYESTNIKGDNDPKAVNSTFNVEDLFKLELLHALTAKETLFKLLEQATNAPEVSENIRIYLAENRDDILDHFMKIKDQVNMEELRFY